MSRSVLLCLLALASPAALAAFPPCPAAPVVIRSEGNLAASGGNSTEAGATTVAPGEAPEEEAPPATDPWMEMWSYHVGSEDLIPLLDLDDDSKPGECNRASTTLPLDKDNASDGEIMMAPNYAPRSVLGMLALPDYRAVAPAGMSTTYALPVEIDNWPLTAAGDWVDLVQIDVANAVKPQLRGILRLRKLRGAEGQRLQLIFSEQENTSMLTQSRDRILAQWAQPDETAYTFTLLWRQRRTSLALGTHATGESVETRLELRKGDGSLWAGVNLQDAFLGSLQFGVLDYHSAKIHQGIHIALGRLSAENK